MQSGEGSPQHPGSPHPLSLIPPNSRLRVLAPQPGAPNRHRECIPGAASRQVPCSRSRSHQTRPASAPSRCHPPARTRSLSPISDPEDHAGLSVSPGSGEQFVSTKHGFYRPFPTLLAPVLKSVFHWNHRGLPSTAENRPLSPSSRCSPLSQFLLFSAWHR